MPQAEANSLFSSETKEFARGAEKSFVEGPGEGPSNHHATVNATSMLPRVAFE